jgi:hypothetical protein
MLPEMALKVARPEQAGTARGEKDGTLLLVLRHTRTTSFV